MDFRSSPILQTTVRKIVPFGLVFALYIFTFGADLPGGGFQAGVVFGTVVILLELAMDYRLFSTTFYRVLEISGILLLVILLWTGFIRTGFLFGEYHQYTSSSLIFPNVKIWLLNLAIFIEVTASMVLIFRYLIGWKREEQ